MSRFEERLVNGPAIVGDGGMGVLVTSAVPRLRCPEEANVKAPESVVTLHTSFIRAGADLIETNTFGANRRKLAQLYLEDELERINGAGVKLAREAREVAGREVFIAGSIGPLGDTQGLSAEQRSEFFAEQARILDGRGVDLFMIETFYDLDELESAIEATRSVSQLPIVATLTFDEGAETLAGVTAAEAAERDRRDPLRGRGGAPAERAARRPRARAAGDAARCRAVRDRASPKVPRERMDYVRRTRPAQGWHLRRDARGRACAQGRRRRLRRHQRQPDGPRAGERPDGVGRDRARLRHRDDPACHSSGHLDHGPRVAPPRRACRGRSQRPLGHGRSARDR